MTILFFPSLLYHEGPRTPEDPSLPLVQACREAPFHPKMEQRIETTSYFTFYSYSDTSVTIDMTTNLAKSLLHLHLFNTFWPPSPFSPFCPRGPGFPWDKNSIHVHTCTINHQQISYLIRRAHVADLQVILHPQGLLGCWKCRCTHMEELGNSPHLSAEAKKNCRMHINNIKLACLCINLN